MKKSYRMLISIAMFFPGFLFDGCIPNLANETNILKFYFEVCTYYGS